MKRSKPSAQQQVRIIGGKWKGQKVRFSGDSTLRPTLGRIRETLFNWIRPELSGARVLDLFAGSGALGLEALSQGAAQAIFVERNRRTSTALRSTLNTLDANPAAKVLCQDALQFLKGAEEPFDIIFVDPPYAQEPLLRQTLTLLSKRHLAAGLVYAEFKDEAALRQAAEQAGFAIAKTSRAGDSTAALLEFNRCDA